MKKKIIGILVGMLLIATALPTVGTMNRMEEPISFSQVDYVFEDGKRIIDSYIGQIKVDGDALASYYGMPTGYLNIMTPMGWVVQNHLISSELTTKEIPYITSGFYLRKGPSIGIDVDSLDVYIDFSEKPTKYFEGGDYTLYPVSNVTHYLEGNYSEITIHPILEFPCFPTNWTIQPDHQNVQAADSQCGPCACANSLQWLEDTYPEIDVPHDLEPGSNGDDTLPGQLDESMGRDPGEGVNTQNFVEGKLRYLEEHDLGQKIKTKHCNVWPSDDYTAGNLTSKDMGDITADWIISEIEAGEDVELKIRYPGDGGLHWVDVSAAGYICGKPFIIHVSDNQQPSQGDPDNTRGCDSFDFEWLEDDGNGEVTLHGGHSPNGTRIDSVVSQSPNDPPETPDQPDGPTSGKPGELYDFITNQPIDPNGDAVTKYEWDFDGDGEVDEVTDNPSVSHSWPGTGTYSVRVRVRDEYGAVSDWSEPLEVTIPKNKSINFKFNLLDWLLERFPYMFPILRQIFCQ